MAEQAPRDGRTAGRGVRPPRPEDGRRGPAPGPGPGPGGGRAPLLRPSTLISTVCLTILSAWYASDGRTLAAWALLALALANLGVGVWRGRNLTGAAAGAAAAAPATPDQAAQELPAQRRARTTWLWITVAGWAGAAAFVLPAPLVGLLLAGVSLYSSQRYVRAGRTVRALESAAGR
jgi:hypothetical protein